MEIRKPSGRASVDERDVLRLFRVLLNRDFEDWSAGEAMSVYASWELGSPGAVLSQVADVLERISAINPVGEPEVKGND